MPKCCGGQDLVVIDTNVVVRLLTGDDIEQTARARNLLATQTVILIDTVALEVEWVLRSSFRYSPADIIAALRAFCALPQVITENAARLSMAVDLLQSGFDFADALHVASVEPGNSFATFAAGLVKAAERIDAVHVILP